MNIPSVKRPWYPKQGRPSGKRYNPDPIYQSQAWKRTRAAFKIGSTRLSDGRTVSNMLCLECFKNGRITAMHTVDHIMRIKDGGAKFDHGNMQSLCASCHAVKSANEANKR